MNRLLDGGKDWTHSSATDIRKTLKQHGHVAPEQRAIEAEQEARNDGALRAMLKIQAEKPAATVTPIRRNHTTKEK